MWGGEYDVSLTITRPIEHLILSPESYIKLYKSKEYLHKLYVCVMLLHVVVQLASLIAWSASLDENV